MSKNRFYIGKREDDGSLEEWITDRIPLPPPPTDQACECACHAEHIVRNAGVAEFVATYQEVKCTASATTFSYRIDEGHVCYTYLCEPCAEAQCSEEYLADHEYPQTEDGYAVVPEHCA